VTVKIGKVSFFKKYVETGRQVSSRSGREGGEDQGGGVRASPPREADEPELEEDKKY